MASDEGLLSVVAVVPRSGGECEEHVLQVRPDDQVEKLKTQIEKLTCIPSDDQEVFFRQNGEGEGGKRHTWLESDKTFAEQGVLDGAILTVGVHGSLGSSAAMIEALGDGSEDAANADAVRASMEKHGDASYYFAHKKKFEELTEDQRVVSGGAPQMLREDPNAPLPTAPEIRTVNDGSLTALVEEEDFAPRRPERHMRNYSWGDDRDFVKVYVSKDNEPEAIAAAGDGKSGQVEVIFKEKKFKLIVHAVEKDYVLLLDRIYYETIPDENTFRVSADKRITVSLKKKEKTTWLKLLKPP